MTNRRTAGRLGRQIGPSSLTGRLALSKYVTDPLPPWTAPDDFSSGVTSWGMLGNDTAGDCGFAARVHADMANAWTAKEEPAGNINSAAWPTADEVTKAYFAYDKGQDIGVDLGEVLLYWTKNPLAGLAPIGGFAQVADSGAEYQSAFHLFGGVLVGINVSQAMMDEFNAGEPWTSTSAKWIGGHAVIHVARNSTWGRCVTWGSEQLFSWHNWRATRQEAWVVLTPEMMAAPSGKFNGIDVTQLAADIQILHGQLA